MNPEKKKALEESGWRVGDTFEFLDLTEEEKKTLSTILGDEKYRPLIDKMMQGLGIPKDLLDRKP